MRLMLAPLILLAACQRGPAPADNSAEAPPPAPRPAEPKGDISGAERLVRERLGNPRNVTFSNPRRSAGDGVPIVCGELEQGGRRQRYIVVGNEDAFVESRMGPGQMDRAVREFCGDGELG